jgi:hypothetical protein
VLVGGIVSWTGICIKHRLDTQKDRKNDDLRKEDLRQMLENTPNGEEWRKLTTLSRVIGADFETTTRLLVEIGARGSEAENEVWALKSKKPLP